MLACSKLTRTVSHVVQSTQVTGSEAMHLPNKYLSHSRSGVEYDKYALAAKNTCTKLAIVIGIMLSQTLCKLIQIYHHRRCSRLDMPTEM